MSDAEIIEAAQQIVTTLSSHLSVESTALLVTMLDEHLDRRSAEFGSGDPNRGGAQYVPGETYEEGFSYPDELGVRGLGAASVQRILGTWSSRSAA